jgi:broad specificity phosphatase PhoE
VIVILARHGNTFAPGESVVWVGRHQDVPLVDAGRTQAVRVAACLRDAGVVPDEIRCGPLSRARQYAAIINAELGGASPSSVDPRLDELDYGAWGGLTREQVEDRFGSAALERWEQESIWPSGAGWGDSAESIEAEVRSLWDELCRKGPRLALLVSSNGRLRFFLKLVGGVLPRKPTMRTGHLSVLQLAGGETKPELVGWNLAPEEALRALRSCMVPS